MKILLLALILFLCNAVFTYSQEYEWGYRFKIGQDMKFKVDNSVYMPGAPIFVEKGELQLTVLNVAPNGDITFLLKEVTTPPKNEPIVIGSESGSSVSIRHATVLDGSEATITMSRFGEFVKGEFTNPSRELQEQRKMYAKASPDKQKESFIEVKELPFLKYAVLYYFPILKKVNIVSNQEKWVDSTATQSETIAVQNGQVVNNTAKRLKYQVTRYTVTGDTVFAGDKCWIVEQQFRLQQPSGAHDTFVQEGSGFVLIRISDGMIMKKTLQCITKENGDFRSNLDMLQELIK